MQIVRDLSGAIAPVPIEVYYNGDTDVDSVTKRYAGSLVKITDYSDIDHGMFYTWAGETTAMENICGILAEEQGTSGNYVPDDATYGMTLKKMFPLLPTSIIRAEYSQADAAGTANYDTAATGSAASTTLTVTCVNDRNIGGWVYFLNGSEANYLHYIEDTSTTASLTLSTALNNAVLTADDWLLIEPACCRWVDFDATYTGIKSEAGAVADGVVGIMHYISAPGLDFQRLDRNKHDNLYIPNARFYHDFVLPSTLSAAGAVVRPNVWVNGINIST